jgi:hypothetical protein
MKLKHNLNYHNDVSIPKDLEDLVKQFINTFELTQSARKLKKDDLITKAEMVDIAFRLVELRNELYITHLSSQKWLYNLHEYELIEDKD